MNRNTATTLGRLREGDRFHYSGKGDVWEVITSTDKSVFVNKRAANGGFILKHHEMKKAVTTVIFLRHTRPLPGEECLIYDLHDGDVFHLVDNIINEYRIIQNGHGRIISCVNNSNDIADIKETTIVCYVGKYQEVKL